jgi:hypothetical protein
MFSEPAKAALKASMLSSSVTPPYALVANATIMYATSPLHSPTDLAVGAASPLLPYPVELSKGWVMDSGAS